MTNSRRNYGALEERVPLTANEKVGVRERFTEVGRKHLERFTLSGDLTVKADFKQLFSDFGSFLGVIFNKINEREFLSKTEEERWKKRFRTSFLNGKHRLELKERRLFTAYLDDGQSQNAETFHNNLVNQYETLAHEHQQLSDEDGRVKDGQNERQKQLREIEFEMSRLEYISHEVMTGRQGVEMLDDREKGWFRKSDEEPKRPREGFQKPSVLQKFRKVFLGTPYPEEEDETGEKFANEIVGEYNSILIGYKISLGIDAKYPREKILAFFEERYPEVNRPEISEEIDRLLKERTSGKEVLSTFQIYTRIMSVIFGKHKLKLLELLGGILVTAGASPVRGLLMRETIQSKTKSDLALSAGGVALAHYGQEWLHLAFGSRLDDFLHTVRYGPEGVFERINKDLFQSASPDLFRNVEAALLRRYVEDAVNQSAMLVRQTLNDIALPLAQAVANAVGIAMRNPLLFIPTLVSSVYADRIGKKKWSSIALLEERERELASGAIRDFEEGAARVKTHGIADVSLERQLRALVDVRSKMTSTKKKYEVLERIWWPFVWLSNALMVTNDQPSVAAAFAETTAYSMQMSADMTRGVGNLRQLQSTIQPIRKLWELITQFREESGGAVPRDKSIEIIDAKRRGLEVEHCAIKPGETLLIIGGEGEGKSTFLEMLAQFPLREEESGAVLVGHTSPSRLDKREYRSGILLSNQFFRPQTKTMVEHFASIANGGQGGQKSSYDNNSLLSLFDKFGFDLLLVQWSRQKEDITQKRDTRIDIEELRNEKQQDQPEWKKKVLEAADKVVLNQDVEPSGGQLKLMSLMFIDFALSVNPGKYHTVMLDEPTAGVSENVTLIHDVVHEWRESHPNLIMAVVDHAGQALFEDPPAGDKTRVLGIKDGKLVQNEPLSVAKTKEGVYRDLRSQMNTSQ